MKSIHKLQLLAAGAVIAGGAFLSTPAGAAWGSNCANLESTCPAGDVVVKFANASAGINQQKTLGNGWIEAVVNSGGHQTWAIQNANTAPYTEYCMDVVGWDPNVGFTGFTGFVNHQPTAADSSTANASAGINQITGEAEACYQP